MRRCTKIYEETNNIEDLNPEEKIDYYPEYLLVENSYPEKQLSTGYEKARYIERDTPPQKNAYKRREQFFNYYTKENMPYNKINQNIKNKKLNTPDRIKNTYNYHFYIF